MFSWFKRLFGIKGGNPIVEAAAEAAVNEAANQSELLDNVKLAGLRDANEIIREAEQLYPAPGARRQYLTAMVARLSTEVAVRRIRQ